MDITGGTEGLLDGGLARRLCEYSPLGMFKVKTAIMNDPDLRVTEINVETFKGIVQLSGFISTRAQIDRAVVVAGDIDGVTSVKNDMRMK